MSEAIKKKRGGQPGNGNARKHGFYSQSLSLEQKYQFARLTNVDGVEPDVAIIRIKFSSAIKRNPGDSRVIRETAKMMADNIMKKYRYPVSRLRAIRKACRRFVLQNIEVSPQINQTNQAQILIVP